MSPLSTIVGSMLVISLASALAYLATLAFRPSRPPQLYYPSSSYPIRVRKRASSTDVSVSTSKPTSTSRLSASTSLEKSYILIPSSLEEAQIGALDTGSPANIEPETEEITIGAFVLRFVPTLSAAFKPAWWLPNGHFQTAYTTIGQFSDADQILYERMLLRLPDGGTIGLDTTPLSKYSELPMNTPIVVVQYGLTGGSHESYVRNILSGVCGLKSGGGLGFRGIVVNFRGCFGVPITSQQWYSAGHTDDLRSALLYISERYPDAPLIGLGFSLGANVLTRYLGEEGPQSRLQGGLVLACPWDVTKNSYRLQNEFIPRHLYSKVLGGGQLALFKSHLQAFQSLPVDDRIVPQIPKLLTLQNPTLVEMDEHLIRVAGGSSPPFPFKDSAAYYEWAASHHSLSSIRVPFLAINAADDPIVGFIPTEEMRQSVTCALAVTDVGGHLGWFEGSSSLPLPSSLSSSSSSTSPVAKHIKVTATPFQLGNTPPPSRWVREPALEFIRALAEEYIPDVSHGPVKLGKDTVKRDGWTLERGKDLVGYQVVSEDAELLRG